MTSKSGLRSGESSTVSNAFPVGGNFSGSLGMMRPWSISTSIVRYAIREDTTTRNRRDKTAIEKANRLSCGILNERGDADE